jgi:hypothetical protein
MVLIVLILMLLLVLILNMVALGGLVVSVLATGPKIRGFKPGRGRWNPTSTIGARRQNSATFLTRVSPASLLDGRRIRID